MSLTDLIGSDYSFQQESVNSITTLENSVNTLIATQGSKPIPPSNTILVDFDTGDDNNDGFTSPVQTITTGAQRILNQYDWQNIFTTIDCRGTMSSNQTLVGSGIQNLLFLSIANTFGVSWNLQSTLSLLNCPFSLSISTNIGSSVSGAGRFDFFSCFSIGLTIVSSSSNTSSLVTASQVFHLTGKFNISSPVSLDNLYSLSKVFSAIYDPDGMTSTTFNDAAFKFSDSVYLFEIVSGTNSSFTGQLYNFTPGSFVSQISDSGALTPSVSQDIPGHIVYNGNLLQGTFADDTAAASGGVTLGQLYNTATGEVRVRVS